MKNKLQEEIDKIFDEHVDDYVAIATDKLYSLAADVAIKYGKWLKRNSILQATNESFANFIENFYKNI